MNEIIEKLNSEETRKHTVSIRETHTATAQVGKDIIEAEYFVFEHSNWWHNKEIKTFKDLLEKIWDVITTPYYKAKWWIREAYWDVRYGFQRMFNGYDEVDTFETFSKFIDRYSKILADYRECHYGYPGTMTVEEWDFIIDEMIYHLKYMDEDTVTEELERNVPDEWSASAKTVGEILDNHKDRFFELFSKYFYHLWD